jgi:hypothetical protein
MSLKLHIIHASEFIRATRKGEGNLKTGEQLLAELARLVSRREDHAILIDGREAELRHSTIDLWRLAADMDEYEVFAGRKIALLVSGNREDVDRAEFFKVCARNRGYYLDIFRDYEEAINWLFLPTDVSPEGPKEQAPR